jgi:acetylornithine deacetylase/succinyl-diaminopimelate desuccinylase-like protein
MLRTTISPTIIKGGFRVNVIPGDAEATLDVRALPDEDMDAFLSTLRAVIDDPAVEVVPQWGPKARPATPPSKIDTEMFAALERAQKKDVPERRDVADDGHGRDGLGAASRQGSSSLRHRRCFDRRRFAARAWE